MESGLEHPGVIDVIGQDEESGATILIMREHRPWTGSNEHLFQLQEKVNAYLSFALDGEMAEAYPDRVDRPIRIQLDCVTPPDPTTLHYLKLIHDQMGFQGIEFIVNVVGPDPRGVSSRDHPEPAN